MHVVVIEKILLVVSVLALAFANAQKDYISKNPRRFMVDAVSAGTAAMGAFWTMFMVRKIPIDVSILLTTFLFFFFFAVCRELSGYYAFMGGEALTSKESQEQVLIKKAAIAGVAVALVSLIGLSLFEMVPLPGNFGLETMMVVTLYTISEIVIAKNHSMNIPMTLATSIPVFVVGHLLLQTSGVYKEVLG